MTIEFMSLDVETANPDFASICQIGIAHFIDGNVVNEHDFLVDPEDWFDPFNIGIHGITEDHVQGAPNFLQLSPDLRNILDGKVCSIHTHFDRSAISQACAKYQVSHPGCDWLDTAKVARRTWEEFAQSGYGLANVAEKLGIEFRHHDALEDAKTSGLILCAAMQETGLGLDEWAVKIKGPIWDRSAKQEGNPEGPLFGESLVFTGAMCIPRREASQIAAKLGCTVGPGVTKKTTMLVVGDQDVTKLAGHSRSSKHRKTLKLIDNGVPIRIIRESDFLAMMDLDKHD